MFCQENEDNAARIAKETASVMLIWKLCTGSAYVMILSVVPIIVASCDFEEDLKMNCFDKNSNLYIWLGISA